MAWWALAVVLLAMDTATSLTYYRQPGAFDFRWVLALLDVSTLVAFYAASGRRVTGFLVSMKLALTLLFVVAIVSIVGTVLPQGDAVIESNWPANPLYNFYRHLGLFEMYKSRWFLFILFMLGFNLTVCIYRRLPGVLRDLRRPSVDVSDKYIAGQPLTIRMPDAGRPGLAEACDILDSMRYRLHRSDSGAVLAQKGRFAPLASLVFHLSFLVIALGGLLGYNFGFDETVVLPVSPPGGPEERVKVRHTDLEAVNEKFWIDSEPVIEDGRKITDIPTDYMTVLVLYRNGEQVARKEVRVNDPLRFEGVNFYQSGYNEIVRSGREQVVSIIQVNRFPGKSLVYAGFGLMTAGVIGALYFPQRRLWLKVDDGGALLVGGRSSRSRVSFQREFDRLDDQLKRRRDRRQSD